MSRGESLNHLSDVEIALYCDKELTHEEMLKVTKHLETCEGCRRLVEEDRRFSGLLYETLKKNLSIEKGENCLSDIEISSYIEGQVSSAERITIEGHLSNCRYCMDIIVESDKFLQEGRVEEPLYPFGNIMSIVKQQLRGARAKSLIEKFTDLKQKGSPIIHNALEEMQANIEAIFKNSFTYPSPHFAPVFGEHRGTILNPFGKIRYPIIFNWRPFKGADSYTVSVENTNWSSKTFETRVEVSAGELRLDYGNEYMWELKVTKGKKIIEEITGFFSIATENELKELLEVEKQLKSVEPELDRLTLWGGILEEKGFYMEAIEQYKAVYALEPLNGIAYRIAYCYDRLELEELRDEWNKRITDL